jgi:hypothetical protein
MVVPLLQLCGIVGTFAGLVAGTGPAVRWVVRQRERARDPGPVRRPLQVVAADVRRLARQLALVPAGAPMVRRRALVAAFEDVLVEAALLLDVPNELRSMPVGSARDLERLRLLAALEAAGLAVRA